jgi:hypothetical protein
VTPLAPMADLRSVLVAAREARRAGGWTVEEIGHRSSSFFCSKNGRRVMVGIERRDPAKPPSMGVQFSPVDGITCFVG